MQILAVVSLLLIAGFFSSKCVWAQEKIRISYSSVSDSYLYAAIAQQKGFFKQEKVDVDLVRVAGTVAVTGLATDDIEYTLMFSQTIQAAMTGIPVKVLASFTDNSTGALVAKTELKTLQDIKGKRLAISSFGAGAHVTADLMLRSAGISADAVKFVALGPENARLAALEQGLVEAAILNPAGIASAERRGFHVIARAYELFTFPYAGLAASDKRIKEKPEEIKRILTALLRGSRYIRSDREGTLQVMMQWARMDKQTATDVYDPIRRISSDDGAIPSAGLRLAIEHSQKRLKIEREVAPSQVANETLIREVQKEMKLKP
jgi:NitT/TauT family transport system substrate-binding protein